MEVWRNLQNFIKKASEELPADLPHNKFCHYTSLPVLFNILDGDECWISNARFSNDASEELLLEDTRNVRDDYIMCFCDSDDQLSQWRGYCHKGGASIEFYLDEPINFSILWSNFNTPTDYVLKENCPLPVIYFPGAPTKTDIRDFKNFVSSWTDTYKIKLDDVLPYVKNNAFCEEREHRMVFSNVNGELDRCIRFRTLDNGIKVPYMVIRCGDIGKMMGKCETDILSIDDTYLNQCYNLFKPIWINEGSNQKEVYFKVQEKVNKFMKGKCGEIRIYCKGHLPIKQIRIAPSDNQDRVVEQLKRFCRSKYWLWDVKVVSSKIPFIRSLT